MKSFIAPLALVVLFATLELSTINGSSITDPIRQKRNVFQQFLINQIINVLPINVRDKINDAAASFGMTRNDFLVRCLKELQAFQTYSKIDFITAIQKTTKFIEEKLNDKQREELENLESEGLQLAQFIFNNVLAPGELNKLYDLVSKVVRQQIDTQSFVDQLPLLIEEILSRHI